MTKTLGAALALNVRMKNMLLSITVFAVTYLALQTIPRDPSVVEKPTTQDVTQATTQATLAIEVPSVELHMADIEEVDVASQYERPLARMDFHRK